MTENRLKHEIPIPKGIKPIKDLFVKNNHKLYIVGGAVRDALLGKRPKDYDLATDAVPDRIIQMFIDEYGLREEEKNASGGVMAYRLNNGQRIGLQGAKFGVIVVHNVKGLKDGVEIATFREDVGSGRRPDSVKFTDISTDVKRRDLTINALFYDIGTGEVVDLVGGIDDLKAGRIKTVGSPEERFTEDRLRILRAIRFAARFGSELERSVDIALKKDSSLEGISPERIRDEFLKGIRSAKSVTHFLGMIKKYDLFKWIFNSKLLPSVNYNFIEERDTDVLLAHLLQINVVYGGALAIQKGLNELKYTGSEIKDITFLTMLQNLEPSNVYLFKKNQRKTKLADDQIRKFATYNGLDIKLIDAFLKFKLSVTGRDVINMGVEKGPQIGKAIERLETEKFNELL